MKERKIEFVVRYDEETIEAAINFGELKPIDHEVYEDTNMDHKASLFLMEAVVKLNELIKKYSDAKAV